MVFSKGKLFFNSSLESIDANGEHPIHIYSGPESIRVEVERSDVFSRKMGRLPGILGQFRHLDEYSELTYIPQKERV